jgi:hypothetical protein
VKRKYYTWYDVTTYNGYHMFTNTGKLQPDTLPITEELSSHYRTATKRAALKVCRYIRTIDKECEIVVVQYVWKHGKRYYMEWNFNG